MLAEELLGPANELGLPVDVVKMEKENSYARLLRSYMRDGDQSIIVIEQDIIPSVEQLRELRDCDRTWCAYAYPPFEDRDYSDPKQVVGLGLCRMKWAMLHQMAGMPDVWFSLRWDHLDFVFSAFARQLGYVPHQHYGDVRHLLTRHGGHYP
jgi:hypothetical protein